MGHYNRRLELGMTDTQVAATETYPKTFDVPQILKWRAQGETAERIFQEARAEIRTSDKVHLDFNELPGSVAGAMALAVLGDVSYYTVRTPQVERTTKDWLNNKGFPNPEVVVICSDPKDKLRKVIADKLIPSYDISGDEMPTVIIVDDSFAQLVKAADEIVTEDPTMRQHVERIILVGFGLPREEIQLRGEFYPKSGLRTLALPDWQRENVDNLISTLAAN